MNNDEEDTFDIRELNSDQLKMDEAKAEEDQLKVIAHIKAQKELLEKSTHESIISNTKEVLSQNLESYKISFNEISKNLNSCYEAIDRLHIQIEIAAKRSNVAEIENYNEQLDVERQKLRSLIYQISNDIYGKSTTLIADCLSKIE